MVNILDNKVFIFDLDGVIIDSEKTHFICYKEAISTYTDMKLDWNTYCEIHHSINKTFKELFPNDYNDIYALKNELYKQSIKDISLISGFYDFFKLLIKHGKQICIVTDAPKEIFDLITSKYPFILKSNVIVTRNDTKFRKPNSECYLQVVKRYINTYELNEIIAFEDSYKGWTAATNVIYNCILVNTPDYFYYNESEKIVIYVTNQKLYSTKNNESVQGLCFGNQIYLRSNIVHDRESSIELIKSNAIHEVAHSFGVSHCRNTCIMNSESFEFWNKVKDEPIFCDDCKSKLPSRF